MTLYGARLRAGLSQAELDRAAGLPIGTIHDLESGRVKDPSFKRVTQIVKALHKHGVERATGEELFMRRRRG